MNALGNSDTSSQSEELAASVKALLAATPAATQERNTAGDLPLHVAIVNEVPSRVVAVLLEHWEDAVLQLSGDGRAVQELCQQHACNVKGLQALVDQTAENATARSALNALLATAHESPPPPAAGRSKSPVAAKNLLENTDGVL